jgi:hypothetical protein
MLVFAAIATLLLTFLGTATGNPLGVTTRYETWFGWRDLPSVDNSCFNAIELSNSLGLWTLR